MKTLKEFLSESVFQPTFSKKYRVRTKNPDMIAYKYMFQDLLGMPMYLALEGCDLHAYLGSGINSFSRVNYSNLTTEQKQAMVAATRDFLKTAGSKFGDVVRIMLYGFDAIMMQDLEPLLEEMGFRYWLHGMTFVISRGTAGMGKLSGMGQRLDYPSE